MATNRINFNNSNTNRSQNSSQSSTDPTGQSSIPLTLSILLSESLFMTRYSPASTLILPFYKFNLPYGYLFILGIELATALFVKWSATPTPHTSSLRNNLNQALPDMASVRKIYNLPPSQQMWTDNVPPGKVSTFSVSPTSRRQPMDHTPLFPKGMTINVSISSPFSEPNGKAATLYTVELLEIKRVPGYMVAIFTLFLYWFLAPSQKPREHGNGNGNGTGNGNGNGN